MQTIRWSVLLKGQSDAVYIAEKEKSSTLITTALYNGRISQVGNAGITLKNVKTGDTGKYDCEVNFGQLRILHHQPDMVVVGKCYYNTRTGENRNWNYMSCIVCKEMFEFVFDPSRAYPLGSIMPMN